MRKLTYTAAFLLLYPLAILAQHCPYDGSAIIVLNIKPNSAGDLINNLKITLLDSLGKPVVKQVLKENRLEWDTVMFWQNPTISSQQGYIDNENPWLIEQTHFWFAEKNYVWVCWGDNPIQKYKVKIEDVDGEANGGQFQTRIVELNKTDFFDLCTAHSHWDLEGKYRSFFPNYKPVPITLSERKINYFGQINKNETQKQKIDPIYLNSVLTGEKNQRDKKGNPTGMWVEYAKLGADSVRMIGEYKECKITVFKKKKGLRTGPIADGHRGKAKKKKEKSCVRVGTWYTIDQEGNIIEKQKYGQQY